MGTVQDHFHHRMIFTSKHSGHFPVTIGDGSAKEQEKLFHALGATQDHTRGNINYFAPLGHIRIGVVEPVWIGLVGVVGILSASHKRHHFLCRHDSFLSRKYYNHRASFWAEL